MNEIPNPTVIPSLIAIHLRISGGFSSALVSNPCVWFWLGFRVILTLIQIMIWFTIYNQIRFLVHYPIMVRIHILICSLSVSDWVCNLVSFFDWNYYFLIRFLIQFCIHVPIRFITDILFRTHCLIVNVWFFVEFRLIMSLIQFLVMIWIKILIIWFRI